MLNSKCKLFVSFTESQNNNISNIISIDINNFQNCYLITSVENIPSCIKKSNILLYKKLDGIVDVLKESYLRTLIKSISQFISNNILHYNVIEIFIPHFMNLISNYLTLNRFSIFRGRKVIVSIYPDGIALFYKPTVNLRGLQKSTFYNVYSRYISGLLIGIPYRPFLGSIIDPFHIIDNIYTYLPYLTKKYSENTVITIPLNKRYLKGKNIIILGSTNYSKLNKTIFYSLIKYLKKNMNDSTVIYYKSHPSIKNDPYTKMLKKYFHAQIISNKTPLESLVEKYEVNRVISLLSFSTALIYLKIIYGQNIECAIFGKDIFFKKKKYDDIINFKKIIKYLDIKLYDYSIKSGFSLQKLWIL